MAMRPLFAASLLGLSLILSTGCGTTTPPPQTTQNTPQPQQTVAITEDVKPVEPAPAAKPAANAPIKRPEVAKIAKDPFVNPFTNPQSRIVSHQQEDAPGTQPPTTIAGQKDAEKTGQAVTQKDPVEKPDFEVRGLVRSGSGMKALLAVADETRIVSNGQSVAGYQVTSIDNRGVTVTKSGQKFRVKMKNEFGL